MVYRARRADRQGRVGAGSASRQAVRRTPSQEHLRVGDAGHRRRARLCVVRRQRRRVLLLAGRQAAVEAHVAAAADLSRLRHRLVAGRARRPRLSAARQRRRVVPRGARREDRQGALEREADRPGQPHEVGLGDAVRLGERQPHRDRHDRPRLRDQLRHRRPRAVAPEGHDAGDAEPGRRRRPALRRIGIAGRSQSPAARDPAGRHGRHLAGARTRRANEFVAWSQPRFSGYTPSPLVYRGRVYAVNDNGVLQVADAKTGAEVYKARVGGGGHTFSSSPLASQGRIYLLSEDGDAFVLARRRSTTTRSPRTASAR